ncbi:hypothetical protein OH76DRAFT_11965 [Lentinus brumalis]|uniref:Uncharacterized protein n=1 Tax=Lentinus brumalis TaxID=2498619 RepID=A0A371DX29_9APHY|nr:hypothetical protein OH76DRAFT_11965 [Polyporus brumalis]
MHMCVLVPYAICPLRLGLGGGQGLVCPWQDGGWRWEAAWCEAEERKQTGHRAGATVAGRRGGLSVLRHKSGQQRRRRGSQTLAQTPRTRARAASRVPEKEMTRIRSQRLWVLSGSLVTRGAGRHEDALDRARGPRLPLSHTEFEGAPFHSPAAASPWRLTQPAIQHGGVHRRARRAMAGCASPRQRR